MADKNKMTAVFYTVYGDGDDDECPNMFKINTNVDEVCLKDILAV